ncbi:hypothetical protein LVD17_19020 [Fulvivirga ulvae]|uniref:hypothetical protein n=1 Tax=Fulvivirga ulvae TaxID=2904245 RepID=UPI001F1B0AD1|nr:hypothetical protein [Fulvivirga ulvae]UII30386.1 hypothetical protein LVD17_19020 [Fulvivirga ulvae]
MYRKRKLIRVIAVFLTVNMLVHALFPSVAWALTSGPNQPEFSSFEPVATTNMVNDFSGDFTYNIPVLNVPGPHGSGYAMSLSYHSGATPEEEASWVGYGWSLNPGAINRNTRGLPDDYSGQKVKYHNKMPANWTATVGAAATFEGFSFDLPIQGNASLRYNNYKGFGYNAGVGIPLGKGVVNLGYNVSNGDGSFSLNVSPKALLSNMKGTAEDNTENVKEKDPKFKLSKNQMRYKTRIQLPKALSNVNLLGSNYGIFSYSTAPRPFQSSDYIGGSVNVSLGVMFTPIFLELGVSGNVFGSFSVQDYKNDAERDVYGYMYSDRAGEEAVMDYYTEKETPYNKKDVFLGIPFNSADNYMVTGEGLGGGFRLYHKEIGQFKPNRTVSETVLANAGIEAEGGFNIGGGGDAGVGVSAITTRDWKSDISSFSSIEDGNESIFFRFNNDLGGEWDHSSGEQNIRAGISGGGPNGVKSFDPSIPATPVMNNGEKSARSSYIGFHTNSEINNSFGTKPYHVYSNRSDIKSMADDNTASIPDGIGEFAVFNESGQRYVYGLPVYSKNEKSIQYGVQKAPSGKVEKNFLVYYKDDKTKFGEEKDAPYATAYLLTEITSPDYVDRTMNGPSSDDFGGYTKFNYKRHAGGGSWYHWRLPYTGLSYNRNSLSDPKDDLGSYSEGDKEIYYLQSIETKTHVAIFNTSVRSDGKDAGTGDDAINNKNAKGSGTLQKLNSIELFSINDVIYSGGVWSKKSGAKALKTIHFDFDYHLVDGVTNSSAGKLTLNKLWFEYEGISETMISPYTFDYAYPTAVESPYPAKYQAIQNEMAQFTAQDQNPVYNEFNIDPWGNYQKDGESRYNDMENWVNQKPETGFDPAAWQLKKITLPTQGEIHIQYEQDDYSYVQNMLAHVMMKVKGQITNRFYLDTDDGIALTNGQVQILKDLIDKTYVRGGGKMYFKFLYGLMGNNSVDLGSCNAEFITGYANVNAVDIDANGLYVSLSSNKLPDDVCKDFVMTQRIGNLNPSGNCDASTAGINSGNDPISIVKQLANMAKSIVAPASLCQNFDIDHSYFKVPAPISKKGGGLRVKRLLMYDKGLDDKSVLYGNEYLYEFNDPATQTVRSSGVATNEPSSIREENALVQFIAREKTEWYEKIIAGDDKKQSEGPLGESILPGPSVGYSRVVIRNIHSGEVNTGFTIKEYHTAKDHPMQMSRTDINDKKDFVPFPFGLVNVFVNNLWLSQGFTFKQNNMHGQFKREANYTGDYSADLKNAVVVTERQLKYFAEDELIPVTTNLAEGVTKEAIGREVDITFGQKGVVEEQYDANVEVDVSLGWILAGIIPIPVPQVTAMPSLTHTRMEMYTHATSKIIRYPAIVKEEITRQDGIVHHNVNLAFDKYTGRPVSVRSYDEFVGSYLQQNTPASWEYSNFRAKAGREGYVLDVPLAYTMENGKEYLSFTSGEACQLLAKFTKGDLLELGDNVLYHVEGFDYLTDRVMITPSKFTASAPAPTMTSMKVLRSGNNNRLGDQAGQITFHSTSPDIGLPDAGDDQRWISNSFTNDLNTAISQLSGNEFTLNGTYQHMNMSTYVSTIPETCDVDLRDVTISNVAFVYFNREGSIELSLTSFKIDCNGTWVTIDAEDL